MPDPLDVGEVAALLLDERKYDQPLTRKEFHKLMYFARQELDELGVSAEVPYFWYKFGTMAPTTNPHLSVEQTDSRSAVHCSLSPSELNLSEDLEARARLAVSRALNRQYELGTEGLTDVMYREAPYDVQRYYRTLDKQLSVLTGKRDDEEVDTSRDAIRERVFDIVDSFPVEEYPELRGDLYVWYDVMSDELDAHDFSAHHAHEAAEALWTVFSVEMAQRANTGVSKEEIVTTLGTDEEAFHQYAEEMRKRLRMWDRERTQLRTEQEDEELLDITEAVAVSRSEIPTP